VASPCDKLVLHYAMIPQHRFVSQFSLQQLFKAKTTRSSAIAEIVWAGIHYAIQCHSWSLILVPIDSLYVNAY